MNHDETYTTKIQIFIHGDPVDVHERDERASFADSFTYEQIKNETINDDATKNILLGV